MVCPCTRSHRRWSSSSRSSSKTRFPIRNASPAAAPSGCANRLISFVDDRIGALIPPAELVMLELERQFTPGAGVAHVARAGELLRLLSDFVAVDNLLPVRLDARAQVRLVRELLLSMGGLYDRRALAAVVHDVYRHLRTAEGPPRWLASAGAVRGGPQGAGRAPRVLRTDSESGTGPTRIRIGWRSCPGSFALPAQQSCWVSRCCRCSPVCNSAAAPRRRRCPIREPWCATACRSPRCWSTSARQALSAPSCWSASR